MSRPATSDGNERMMDELTAEVLHRLEEIELMTAVRFLAETGHASDTSGQEFVLLSDTLGVSSLVDRSLRPATSL